MLENSTSAHARIATQGTRRRPTNDSRLEVWFDEVLVEGIVGDGPPAEVLIHATNSGGEIAPWLTDGWWMEVVGRWADEPLVVQVMPTPGATLHPVVLAQVEMLRRVAPAWRLIGHAHAAELYSEEAVRLVAASPYHEIRVPAEPPKTEAASPSQSPARIEQVFARIRERQQQLGATKPILIRLAPNRNTASRDQPPPSEPGCPQPGRPLEQRE